MPGEEESIEEVDIIQSALQESSACLSDVEWASDTLNDDNPPTVDTTDEVIHVPHLWTHASPSQQLDMDILQQMERIHGIQPTGTCCIERLL